MARYIDADPRTRYFQYARPAAAKALREGWADLERQEVLNQVKRLGDRPSEEGIQQRRWDRRIEALRNQFRAIARQERRNRWLAGQIDCPPEVRKEFEEAGQSIPAWLRK